MTASSCLSLFGSVSPLGSILHRDGRLAEPCIAPHIHRVRTEYLVRRPPPGFGFGLARLHQRGSRVARRPIRGRPARPVRKDRLRLYRYVPRDGRPALLLTLRTYVAWIGGVRVGSVGFPAVEMYLRLRRREVQQRCP